MIFNQTVLKSIIETISFCGCQELSLRNHRDDPQFYNSSLLEFTSVNVGNFLELIRFQVAGGDETFGWSVGRSERGGKERGMKGRRE